MACRLLNRLRTETINWCWQTVMVVGGLWWNFFAKLNYIFERFLLRGAIAFAAEYDGPYNKRFYDCTILVILFTTLVQVGFLTAFNISPK